MKKKLRIIWRFINKKELQPKEYRFIDDIFLNIKSGLIAIVLTILVVFLLHTGGCFDRKVTKDDFNEINQNE